MGEIRKREKREKKGKMGEIRKREKRKGRGNPRKNKSKIKAPR